MPISSGKFSFCRGFTLMEVLVVLLIIGLSISALSAFNYTPASRKLYNLRASAAVAQASMVKPGSVAD